MNTEFYKKAKFMGKGDKANISLIGMPAAGKTTIGTLLAQHTGFGFVDTDHLIQTGENMTLAQIISAFGLPEFLNIEAGYLLNLNCRKKIIATGGSVVYKKKAMDHLVKISVVVYLEIGLAELVARLSDLEKRGVAIGPGQDIQDLYQERIRLYEQYHDIKVRCDSLPPLAVVQAIEDRLTDYQENRYG